MVSPHLEAMQEPIKSCLIIGKDVSITQEVLSNLGALCQKLEAQTSVFIYFFLWFHIQEIIAACSVVTPLSCVFFADIQFSQDRVLKRQVFPH